MGHRPRGFHRRRCHRLYPARAPGQPGPPPGSGERHPAGHRERCAVPAFGCGFSRPRCRARAPSPAAEDQDDLRRSGGRKHGRGPRPHQRGRRTLPAVGLAGRGGSRHSGAGHRSPHSQRLRRAGADQAARRDNQARRAGRGRPDRCRWARTRPGYLPPARPAPAGHPARRVAQHGDLGVDPAFGRLPARVLPGIDLAGDSQLAGPLPTAGHGNVTAPGAAPGPRAGAPARKVSVARGTLWA